MFSFVLSISFWYFDPKWRQNGTTIDGFGVEIEEAERKKNDQQQEIAKNVRKQCA